MSIQEDWADPSAPPKRRGMGTGMKILVAIGVLFGVACLACCGGVMWLGYSLSNSLKTKPEEILAVQESIVSITPPPNVKPAMAMDVLGTFKMVIYNKTGKADEEEVPVQEPAEAPKVPGADKPAGDAKPPEGDKPADDPKSEGDAVAAADGAEAKPPEGENPDGKEATADNVAAGEPKVAEGDKDAVADAAAADDEEAEQVVKTADGPRVFLMFELPKSLSGGRELNDQDFENGMRSGGRGEGGLPSVNVLKTEFKEYEIRGQKVKVSFQTGTEQRTGVSSKQVKCVIPSKGGSAILIYIASKDDWDDKAVDNMLKSIK